MGSASAGLPFAAGSGSIGAWPRCTTCCGIFECRDARTADLLSSRKELVKACLRAGETTLAVREDAIATFRKQARALGFGIR